MGYINKNKMAETGHVDLNLTENYIRNKAYPEKLKDKGHKANFTKACKKFTIADGHILIFEESRKQSIIHDVHGVISDSPEAVALSGYRGRESTYQKISERFYWHGMVDDVKNYIKTCQKCQYQGKIFKKISPDLQSIPMESEMMKQVGVDLRNLPEVNGFKHLIVLIDYFSKWSEVKPVKDKSAPTVAAFLYEVM